MWINVELVARDAWKAAERRDVIIVVDVLRCTSSIITALANGAKSVIPVRTVKEARRRLEDNPQYLLAGERGGNKPKGFALGNSPLEFTKENVAGKHIIMTTTSGTAALSRVQEGKHVLIGAILNARSVAAVAQRLSEHEACGVSIVLAGKRGHFSLEDFLGAGAILDQFPKSAIQLSDAAFASLLTFQKAKENLVSCLLEGNHAKALSTLGFTNDIQYCSQLDKLNIVPQLQGDTVVLK